MNGSMKKIILIIPLLIFFVKVKAADLPSKGLSTPVTVQGPGTAPPDPGMPIGNGLIVLLGSAGLYLYKKQKQNKL